MCGVLCAPSTTTTAPNECALSAIFRTGFSVPSTLETCPIATIFAFSVIFALISSSV